MCGGVRGGKLTLDLRMATMFTQDSERPFGTNTKDVGSRERLWRHHFQTLTSSWSEMDSVSLPRLSGGMHELTCVKHLVLTC